MDESDRQRDLRYLAEGRDALLDSVRGLSEADAAVRPAPERWSVLECIEHVCNVEDRMLGALETRLPLADLPGPREREESVIRFVTARQEKMVAPARVLPTGRFSTLAQAIEHFSAVRARAIAFIEICDRDLRMYRAKHPVLGEITGEELLLVLALHPARHAGQIRETREALKV